MMSRSTLAARFLDRFVTSSTPINQRLYRTTQICLASQTRRLDEPATILQSDLFRKCGARFSTSARSNREEHIMKCPFGDIDLPETPFLAHHIMENWHLYTNRVAMINGDTGVQMTYGQLQTQIVKTSSALVKQGFTKGDVMMMISPNCPEFAVIYLAAASIGMIVSTVNPAYTKEELVNALNLSASKLLVFSPILVDVVNAALPNCVSVNKTIALGPVSGHQPLDDLLNDDGKSFKDNIDYNSKEDTIALPFSSGTSGKPKGVMLTNHSIVSNMLQTGSPSFLNTIQDDVYVGVLPMFHIFAQIVLMALGLRHGTRTVVMSKFDPVAFLEHIQNYKPTHLHIVPPIMLFLANHPIVDKYDISSVETIFYAAAPMSRSTLSAAQNRLSKNVKFVQGYGMTEMSPGSHINPFHGSRPETVGLAVHNTQFKIIDTTTNELLPANKEGEVCVKGPQVMKGYFKNEQATQETIIDGWLHTGDIAYYDEDGFVTITDRLKELIKYKGFQVAPAELEDLLLSHPAVQDAAVIGKPDEAAGELPRAYVVLKPDAKTTEDDIKNFVKEKCAPYKQLSGGVEFRSEIPKAASGKILRRILRDELQQEKA